MWGERSEPHIKNKARRLYKKLAPFGYPSGASSSTTPVSRKVWLYFQITQHERDILLLERIVTYLGCGVVKKRNTLTFNTCDYKLSNFHKIDSKILPFFLRSMKYSLPASRMLKVMILNVLSAKLGSGYN